MLRLVIFSDNAHGDSDHGYRGRVDSGANCNVDDRIIFLP